MRASTTLLIATIIVSPGVAAEREWRTGTCVDAGIARDFRVGTGVAPLGSSYRSAVGSDRAEVATYVVDVGDERIDLQDIAPIGKNDLMLSVGDRVTIAVEKKVAYVRGAHGEERRFRVVKRRRRPPPR